MDLRELPGVVSVNSPFEQPGAISPDGTTAFIEVRYAKQAFEVEPASVDALLDARRQHSTSELQVEAGGQVVQIAERELPGRAELLGLAVAVAILFVSFGSVVAMVLPIATAVVALSAGILLSSVAAGFLDMPTFSPQLATMIGLGAGIDYSLLVVTRFREELRRGTTLEDAIVVASATAGRSVLFAGLTVVIALSALWLAGLPALAAAATSAVIVVALAVVVALIVLPALLRLVGARIDRWQVPILAHRPARPHRGLSYRLPRLIQRRPLVAMGLSLSILLVLAVPALSLNLGVADAGSRPQASTARRAYDLVAGGFGVGANGPILVGVRIDDPSTAVAVEGLPGRLASVEGVAAVSPAHFNLTRSAAIVTVIPAAAPESESTEALVHRLRTLLRNETELPSARPVVGGPTAAFIDMANVVASRMPVFFAVVIAASFVLLMAVFRSVLVPLKAAVMNLLSIAAAYGVLVAVFQWGWGGGVIGIERGAPIESFQPIMMFAILFGLSMDYEVFLISRIREEYLRTGDNSEAVARGLSTTTRVISAAAAIMTAVFLSFAFGDLRLIKEFGLGLATAIFLDATIIRLVLVPSTMHLLGDANWWFPHWLDRAVPRLGVGA